MFEVLNKNIVLILFGGQCRKYLNYQYGQLYLSLSQYKSIKMAKYLQKDKFIDYCSISDIEFSYFVSIECGYDNVAQPSVLLSLSDAMISLYLLFVDIT